jgi:hypothetical protein
MFKPLTTLQTLIYTTTGKLFQIENENELVLTLKNHYMKMHGITKAKFFNFFVIYTGE